MPKYKFTWEFEVDDTETPEQAFIEAWDALINPDSIAHIVIMEETDTGSKITLDVDQIDEDFSNSGKGVTLMDTIRQHIGDTFKK